MRDPTAALLAFSLVLAGAPAACGGGPDAASEAGADGLTPRQRDSALGEPPVPGASGVKGALEVSDRARERAARLDSAAGRPDR